MSVVTREALHRLVDELPESEYPTVQRLLEGLRSLSNNVTLYSFETAPFDDEEETEEERVAVDEGRAALARGDVISHDVIRREVGL